MIPSSDVIPFGEWLPDLGAFQNPGALTVTNCIATATVYKPFYDILENSPALPNGDVAIGAFAYRDSSGNTTVFAGSKSRLYRLVTAAAWTDVTRTSGLYSGGSDSFWTFLNFGNLVIATNYNDDMQVFNVGGGDTHFSQLSSTAPRCRNMFVTQNYLVALNTVDGDGAKPYRVRWSSLANPQGDWTPAPATTGADFQDIYGGDYANTFGVDLEDYAVIVQGRGMQRMDFVGGTEIFTFTPLAKATGSIYPRGCTTDGESIFMLDEAGFAEYTGSGILQIGDGKVNKWFAANVNQAYTGNINSAFDKLNKNAMWAFPSNASSTGVCDMIMVYNVPSKRFTLLTLTTEVIFSYYSTGYTLEGLDTVSMSIDTLPYSLDSAFYTGGKTIMGCFSQNSKMAAFAGAALTATVGTPEVRLNQGGRTVLHNLQPYVEGGALSVRCATRATLQDVPAFTGYVAQNPYTGEFDFTLDATYHRAEMQISGAWTQATGVSFRAEQAGGIA